jgi:hypothetical protein
VFSGSLKVRFCAHFAACDNGTYHNSGVLSVQVSSSGFALDTFTPIAIIAIVAVPVSVTVPVVVRQRKGRAKKIRPILGEGGAISPSTEQTIVSGGDSTVFILTVNDGFKIADVVIDNVVHLGCRENI